MLNVYVLHRKYIALSLIGIFMIYENVTVIDLRVASSLVLYRIL